MHAAACLCRVLCIVLCMLQRAYAVSCVSCHAYRSVPMPCPVYRVMHAYHASLLSSACPPPLPPYLLARPRRACNRKIISEVQQVICFAFHDSRLLLETCHEAKDMKKIVTLFYLD